MIARIIRQALEILNGKTGITWEKGYMGHLDAKFDDEGVDSFFDSHIDIARVTSVCTLGALELSARQLRGTRSDFENAANFVAKIGAEAGLLYSPNMYDIADFNDNEERTQNEVTSLLRQALVAAENAPITVTPEPALA